MMAKSPVPEVSHVALRGVQPFMQPEVFMGLAAVLPG
jgi:hypothetical protein